jgi:hypothetical protein
VLEDSQNARRMSPPGKRPDAAPSVVPPGSPRPISQSRTDRPSRLPCRHVAAFSSPPAALVQTPSACQMASRKAISEALPGDRPRCRLCSGPGIRWIPRPSQQSTLRRRKPKSSRRRPRNGLLPQSRRRDPSPAHRCAK